MSIRIANDHGQATLYLGGRLDTTVARQRSMKVLEALVSPTVSRSMPVN